MTDYVRDQFDDESISQELLDIAEERAAPPPAAPSAPPAGKPRARRIGFIALGILILLAALGYGVSRLLAPPVQDTDDAYVGGNIVSITARQGGTVLALHADNTQRVAQGDTLIDLDPAQQDVALAAAEAKLGQAVRDVRSGQSAVAEGSAEIAKAQSDLARAQADYSRRSTAAASGAISGEELSHAQDAVSAARAALDLASARRGQAASTVAGTDVANNPQVLAAIAEVRKAAIDRAYMTIKAPVAGIVAQRNVQLGQQVAAGTPLMAVVPLDSVWIDANFRETQLADLRVGQPVSIKADVYGSKVTFHGKVIGMGAGSGNAFSLLPPQNASGNWIKIVQRVPVRIALDPKELQAHPLRIGLSAKVTVDTSDRSGPLVASATAPAGGTQQSLDGGPQVDALVRKIIAANLGGSAK
ncbi:MAG TPA: HlyD family efflux transporter periplasmic adaptor subunit [Reyranella sp.]|nr:HlyD family efflux transporter periplasmic adaptor subunit [Reyranella sp.]